MVAAMTIGAAYLTDRGSVSRGVYDDGDSHYCRRCGDTSHLNLSIQPCGLKSELERRGFGRAELHGAGAVRDLRLPRGEQRDGDPR